MAEYRPYHEVVVAKPCRAQFHPDSFTGDEVRFPAVP